MSTQPKPVSKVLSVRSAKNIRVVMVEGVEDSTVYMTWLKKLLGAGELVTSRVELVDAEGKPNVLRALQWFRDHGGNPSDIFAIVDRDEWDAATVAGKRADLPQLRVNENRHSLESYFCDPTEIAPALVNLDRATFERRLPSLDAQVAAELPARVDHWCLFSVTERVKQRMLDAQFPGVFHNQYVLPSDEEIRSRLRRWSELTDADAVFQEFSDLRDAARARSRAEQLCSCVWSGPFFDQIICGGASGLQSARAQNTRTWMTDLAEYAEEVPRDIATILQEFIT